MLQFWYLFRCNVIKVINYLQRCILSKCLKDCIPTFREFHNKSLTINIYAKDRNIKIALVWRIDYCWELCLNCL